MALWRFGREPTLSSEMGSGLLGSSRGVFTDASIARAVGSAGCCVPVDAMKDIA